MPRDLRRLLDDTAASPARYPGSSALIRRGRRRRRTHIGAGVGAVAVVAVLGVVFVPRLAPPPPNSVIFQPAPTATTQSRPAAPEDLLGRTFVSTEVQRPEGPLLPGTSIMLSLRREGKNGAGWDSGCNGSTGTLNVGEQTLSIRQTSTTLMGCGEGNAQDEWVVGFLGSGPRWELVGDTLTLSQGDRRVTFTSSEEGSLASATATPEADTAGPRLDLRSLPPLPDEGVAVTVDRDVVLIGLDGTVHGHIPGRVANDPFFGFDPKRQGLTHLLRVEPDGGIISWIDPASGRYLEGYEQAAPLRARSRVAYDAHGGPQNELQLDRGPQLETIGWPGDSRWFVSADHRLVTWLPCEDGACAAKFYDSDDGGIGTLENGCRAAHAFADFALTQICDNGGSIVLPKGADGASETIPVPPAADGAERRFVAVYDKGTVRVDTPECRTSTTYRIRDGRLRPVDADVAAAGGSLVPLGVLDDGRIVVHANADAQCVTPAAVPGVYVVDPDSGEATRVWAGSADVGEVQMWAPTYAL